MRRHNYSSQQDPQESSDRDAEGGRGSHALDDDQEPDEEPMRVGRRAGVEDDDTEEIDLADEDIDEVSELDEELDAKKGEGPDV